LVVLHGLAESGDVDVAKAVVLDRGVFVADEVPGAGAVGTLEDGTGFAGMAHLAEPFEEFMLAQDFLNVRQSDNLSRTNKNGNPSAAAEELPFRS
jgi:hypothetical protein